MKNRNGVVYERITVLAVHILNASELPFEKDGRILLERYQRFLFDCSEIMCRQKESRDVLVSHNRISCIYAGYSTETLRKVAETATQIEKLAEKMNLKNQKDCIEKIVMGIGIAAGVAMMVSINANNVWMGPVVERAQFLSQAAIDYGGRKIFAERGIYDQVYELLK